MRKKLKIPRRHAASELARLYAEACDNAARQEVLLERVIRPVAASRKTRYDATHPLEFDAPGQPAPVTRNGTVHAVPHHRTRALPYTDAQKAQCVIGATGDAIYSPPHTYAARHDAGRHSTVVVRYDASESATLTRRDKLALRDAESIAAKSTAIDRDAARDFGLAERHARYDGAARRGIDGLWYDCATLAPLPRNASAAPCATVKGSAPLRPSYSTTSDAALSAPTDDPNTPMTRGDVTRRVVDDAACRRDAETLVNAARCATMDDIDALCHAFLKIRLTWSVKYEIDSLGRIFNALRGKSHRVKLHRALRDAKRAAAR